MMSNLQTHPGDESNLDFIRTAVDALGDSLRIDVAIAGTRPAAAQAGASMEVALQIGERHVHYLAVLRPETLNTNTLTTALAGLSSTDTDRPTLLVTSHLTRGMAETCIARQAQFIDLAGNAFLHADGLHIQIVGRRLPERANNTWQAQRPLTKATSTAALHVMFAVMRDAELLNKSYRDIAHAAGVSVGSVAGTFDSWRARHLLSDDSSKAGRHLLSTSTLLDEWVIGYEQRIYPKLPSQRFTLASQDWWVDYDVEGLAQWGGEVAVNKVFGELRPAAQTLYVKPDARHDLLKNLAMDHRLRADPMGSLEVVDAFWEFDDNYARTRTYRNIAPAPLVYADLMRTREPRNREAARALRNAMETSNGFDWA
ncbi:hypothetical protein PIN31009_04384 [Pandoraea iniqua]|uniref:type IV toxin-antitoxin system AbiEi family antitoxin n=1 Tax=Pandoraea iniqua TaxID=2508288 RepID=UPI001242F6CB|nr:type IV toxin-antitoxin system AbiEi family antitoxin [Pandoraea iniqua]VVE46198.1 hypothetical protein PIN31009_04384 [Pandoraea iniqua]